MPKQHSVNMKIDGNEYSVLTRNSSEYMQRLAELCDETLHEVAERYPQYGISRRYTLALLEISDRYLKLQQEYEAMRHEIDNLTAGEWK